MIVADDVATRLVEACVARGVTVATCESLTGGGVGAAITAVPGASAVYRGGFVTYATELKVRLVGVDADHASLAGVVNERVAVEMAQGARRRCAARWAVSTTGVAGPEPSDGEPVGTVWIGVAGPDGQQCAERHRFAGDRATVRALTVGKALEILLREVGAE